MRAAICFASLLFATTSFAVDAQCDYPGANLKTEKTADAAACEKLCASHDECTRWVYVSGWGRCALRKGNIKKRSVTMWSAEKNKEPIENKDHSAKDFKKVSQTKSAKACANLCNADSKCIAMTYIAGYSDCYLKTNSGRYRDKIFYCGVKETP